VEDLIGWLRAQPLTEPDRAILDAHAKVVDGSQDSWAWFQGSESESERELRLLAAVHAGRPGFREEWLP
jgi:hypothetical protein